MSDTSQGEGWWQASDGKWYPPDAVPGPDPNQTVAWKREGPAASPFEPPSPSPFEPAPSYGTPPGYGTPPAGPPPGYGPPPGSGPPPAGAPPGYGTPVPPGYGGIGPPPKKSSRTVWIVLAVVVGGLAMVCVGCVALIGIGASQSDDLDVFEVINEATLDFSDGVPPAGPTSCEVTGIQTDGTNDYAVDAIVTNADGVTSHYEVSYELLGPSGDFIGSDFGIISDVEPGETVRDFTLGIVDGPYEWTDVSCEVTLALRIDA